jgi:hypothetical protein
MSYQVSYQLGDGGWHQLYAGYDDGLEYYAVNEARNRSPKKIIEYVWTGTRWQQNDLGGDIGGVNPIYASGPAEPTPPAPPDPNKWKELPTGGPFYARAGFYYRGIAYVKKNHPKDEILAGIAPYAKMIDYVDPAPTPADAKAPADNYRYVSFVFLVTKNAPDPIPWQSPVMFVDESTFVHVWVQPSIPGTKLPDLAAPKTMSVGAKVAIGAGILGVAGLLYWKRKPVLKKLRVARTRGVRAALRA